MTDGFSPLSGLLTRDDYESVCARMRLANGALWPIPVTLDVDEELARSVGPGKFVALRDPEGVLLAGLRVDEVWTPDRRQEARAVFGTEDARRWG